MIATDVEGVMLNYGRGNQTLLHRISVDESEYLQGQGQFPEGSMLPKVTAATEFILQGGDRALIASIEHIEEAVAGRAGTEFVK